MSKDLRMEAFASNDSIQPVKLHVYELHTQKIDNAFSIIRGAVWKIRNYTGLGVFEDGKFVYSINQITKEIPNVDFSLEYVGEKELPVAENKKIYCELIKYFISEQLKRVQIFDKYRKYSCKSEITSKWIFSDGEYRTYASKNKEISLERKYDFWITISDDGIAYLQINTGSIFSSNLTVYDYLTRQVNPVAMEVKNDWSNNRQSGVLTEICDCHVTDKVGFADSLKAYYIEKGEGYRVEGLPDDTPVVMVELQPGKKYPYYPQALKPILTREKVGEIDPSFSLNIEKHVKRDMLQRLQLDQELIRDIGTLSDFGNLSFYDEPCTVEELGYKKGTVPTPTLICGQNRTVECGKEIRVFSHGFYRKPDRKLKIGYIYPKNSEDKMGAVVNSILEFSTKGKFHGEDDPYILKDLLDIQYAPMIKEEYELGDTTDYKRAALKLQKVEGIDIVIALVPDGMDNDGPYNPFKTIWAKANIPSQMISMKTASLFLNEAKDSITSKYFLHNIVLGILGKTGGIPWIVKDMPGDVDCFVGLDVATVAQGIHYPACSVVFDKYGKLLGFYKPTTPQQGEKITKRILQDIFDQVIFSYEEEYGESPKHVVIHRDGFSNEDDNWYECYFGAKDIEYSIIEVRKNNHTKLMLLEDDKVINPTMGYCIYNKDKGYLVTTNLGNKKGSPNPLLIEKKCGNLSMPTILTQILYLSQLHVGSTHKLRLPITTGYADKICKNKDFVPEGKMDDRLFFL